MPATSPAALLHKRQRALARLKERMKENPEFRTAYYRKQAAYRRGKRPISTMLRGARARAKQRGLPFSLSATDITIPAVCPVFGTPLVPLGTRVCKDNSPSLDRVDNTKGYTPDNVWVISNRANMLKNSGTLEEFEKIVLALKARRREEPFSQFAV